jgi:hypothetical protein
MTKKRRFKFERTPGANLISLVLVISTLVCPMRKRVLTDLQRKFIERYIASDGERDPTLRSIARYARQIDMERIRNELALIEKFIRVYERRNGKK